MDVQHLQTLFTTYPYKNHQHRISGISKEKRLHLSAFYAKNFLHETLAWTLHADELNKETHNSDTHLVGIASLKKFTQLSTWLTCQAYLLKDFFVLPGADPSQTVAAYTTLWQKIETTLNKQGSSLDVTLTRIASENIAAIHALSQQGFHFIASEAIFTLTQVDAAHLPPPIRDELTRIDHSAQETTPLHFRLATHEDLLALQKLIAQSPFPNRYSLDGRFSEEKVAHIYQQTLAHSMSADQHFIALCELSLSPRSQAIPIGFISFIRNQTMSDKLDLHWGSLDYIIIDPNYRKRHLASMLNAWAVRFLSQMNAKLIQVKTLTHNYPSTALLSRTGFTLTSLNVLLHRIPKKLNL